MGIPQNKNRRHHTIWVGNIFSTRGNPHRSIGGDGTLVVVVPKSLRRPPGNVSLDRLVEAAYEGKSVPELAKDLGVSTGRLRRYIKKVWPRYYLIVGKSRQIMRFGRIRAKRLLQLRDSNTSIYDLNNAFAKKFAIRNLPMWAISKIGSEIAIARRHRPAALADIRMMNALNAIVNGEKPFRDLNKMQSVIGIRETTLLRLLIGSEMQEWEKEVARRKHSLFIRAHKNIGELKLIRRLRKKWYEMGVYTTDTLHKAKVDKL